MPDQDDLAPEEPGDKDALPHLPVTPSDEIPPDQGDIGEEADNGER